MGDVFIADPGNHVVREFAVPAVTVTIGPIAHAGRRHRRQPTLTPPPTPTHAGLESPGIANCNYRRAGWDDVKCREGQAGWENR